MKGSDKVIDFLNEVLTGELTAVSQYWVHARMCENWGYDRLWNKVRAEAIDEMKHADQLVERVLYLEGMPNLQRLGKVMIGETVPEQLKVNLELERQALERLRGGVTLCLEEGDHGSRDLIEKIIVSEEDHVDWLEAQLDQIEQVGVQNYLAAQIKG